MAATTQVQLLVRTFHWSREKTEKSKRTRKKFNMPAALRKFCQTASLHLNNTHRGARAHDHKVKNLALYRLSYLQIFSLTLFQLSYRGSVQSWRSPFITLVQILLLGSPWIRSVHFWRGPHGKGLLGSGCRGLKNFKPRLAQRVCSCTCPHGGATCWNMMMEQWGKCGK